MSRQIVPGRDGNGGRQVTLEEIARIVGVSRATVSNAYNRPDQLSAALRERILETARELGYPGPDPAARSLRRGVAASIGVALTETLSYAFSDSAAIGFLHGLTRRIEPQGLSILLVPASPRRDAAVVRDAIVDGFVVYSMPADDPHVAAIQGRGQPVVFVDQPHVAGMHFVGVDIRAASRRLTEHLLELGHRRLAVVSFPLGPDMHRGPADLARQAAATREVTRDRLRGYRDAVEAHGLDWGRVRVEERLRSGADEGRDAGLVLLSARPRPTAVLAMSDHLALGVVEAAHQLGLRVPGDVSVVGFDDIPGAAAADPPLTTMRQPLAGKGEVAGELLLESLAGAAREPQVRILPTELVTRGSTAAPPGAARR
jgi:DNA-binding LacI/PurR family transcriptional regulator